MNLAAETVPHSLGPDGQRAVLPKAGSKITSIEGLRGFLAMAVVFFHVFEMGGKAGFYASEPNLVVQKLGAYIVCIFFCVSGFLIIQTLIGKHDVAEFFKNRMARIYPVFIVLHLAMFALGPMAGYEWMGKLRGHPMAWLLNFISNLLFLPGLLNLPIAQKNAWSLSFEAAFYIIAAASYWSWRGKGSVLGRAGLVLSACASLLILYFQPDAGFFLIGVSAYLLSKSNRLPAINGFLAAIAFLAGLWSFAYLLPAAMVFVSLFFLAVVEGSGLVGQFFSTGTLRFLGKISYSLYLVHPFALLPVRLLLLKAATHSYHFPAAQAFAILGPLFSIVLAYASFFLIEKRLTRLVFRKGKSEQRLDRSAGEPLSAEIRT